MTDQPAAWRAYLSGDSSSIDRLVTLFAGSDIEVTCDGETSYLRGSAFDSARTAEGALRLSRTLLPRINAALRLNDVTRAPVALDDRISDGAGPVNVFGEVHLSIRATLSVGGDPGPRIRRAAFVHAAANPKYAAALDLFGSSPDLRWSDLYKVFELLQHAAGGDLSARTGASSNQVSAFTSSANDAGVSGADARHAIPRKQPPLHTMTLPEGQEFIRSMLRNWT